MPLVLMSFDVVQLLASHIAVVALVGVSCKVAVAQLYTQVGHTDMPAAMGAGVEYGAVWLVAEAYCATSPTTSGSCQRP
jgi:hypothetical protein